MPFVSVCIPAYNNPHVLKKCVESVLAQTFEDFECIVTDDSRGTCVRDVLEPFCGDKRLVYVKNEISQGTPQNWNTAIGRARGKYIKILHHDDFFTYNTSLQEFCEAASCNPWAAFIVSDCLNFYSEKDSVAHGHAIDVNMVNEFCCHPHNILLCNIIGAPSVTLIRRDAHEEYDRMLKWLVDVELYYRIVKRHKLFHISAPLISIQNGCEGQVSLECVQDYELQINELLYCIKKHSLGKEFDRLAVDAIIQILMASGCGLSLLRKCELHPHYYMKYVKERFVRRALRLAQRDGRT